MKITTLCTALLGVSLNLITARALPQETRVTIQAQCDRVPKVLLALSKKVGITLRANPIFENEVIAVSVKDVQRQDLLNRIATSVGGEWQPQATGLYLTRSKALLAQQQMEDFMLVKEMIKSEIAYWKKNQLETEVKPLPHYAEEITKNQPLSSAALALNLEYAKLKQKNSIEVISSIDVEAVAKLEIGERKVWKTNPNSAQSPYPGSVQQFLKGTDNELKILEKAQNDLFEKTQTWPQIYTNVSTSDTLFLLAERVSPYRIHIRYSAGRFSDGDELTIQLDERIRFAPFDPRGNEPPKPLKYVPSIKLKAPESEVTVPVDLAKVRELRASLVDAAGNITPENDAKVLAAAQAMYRHPDQKEILGYYPFEILKSLAEDQAANLVAYIPDGAANIRPGFMQPYPRSKALYDFDKLGQWKANKEGSWLHVIPTYPSLINASRLSRKILSEAILDEQVNGRVTLAARIKLALAYTDYAPNVYWEAQRYFMKAGDYFNIDYNNFQESEPAMLRLLGSLAPAQYSALENGNKIPYRDLSDGQQKLFKQCMGYFIAMDQPDTIETSWLLMHEKPRELTPDITQEEYEALLKKYPQYADASDAEPLLPQIGLLSLKIWKTTVVQPTSVKDSSANWVLQPMTAEELAQNIAFQKLKQFKSTLEYGPLFLVGSRNEYRLDLSVGNVGCRVKITEPILGKAPVPESEFPSDFLKTYRDLLPRMLKGVELLNAAEAERQQEQAKP
jgi:hypothetical protein